MEDGVSPSDTMLGTLSDIDGDFDLMDQLLLGGCWIETTEGSDFLLPSPPSSSTALLNSLYLLPAPETNNDHSKENPPLVNNQEERKRPAFQENSSSVGSQTENLDGTQSLKQSKIEIVECSLQSDWHPAERNFELSRRWWIGPSENPGLVSSVRERLIQALGYIESIKGRDLLIQIWVPIESGGKQVLTTIDQPFSFDPNCQRLASYRSVSMNYQFPAEEDSKESFGLLGQVFLGKVPEWTPDVRFFSRHEYPRIGDAQRYDVRGTLALPVFQRGSQTCLGVVEVVTTTQKINYHADIENICKALETVDLRSSELSSAPHVKVCNEPFQTVLPEILEGLRAVCETYRLPLAQTWVPCIQQSKQGRRHSDANYAYCISTVDSTCCVTDPRMRGFHEACSEHHLFRGQGLPGQAFMTNQLCFSTDVTALSKMEYPLSHYARIFGLRAAAAIRLRSIYTETADYVLEFFLPVGYRDTDEQKMMLNSLSIIMQRLCKSLRVITDKELEEEIVPRIGEAVALSDGKLNGEEIPKLGFSPPNGSFQKEPPWIAHDTKAQQKGKSVQLEFQKEDSREKFRVTTHWDNPELLLNREETFSKYKQQHQFSGPKDNMDCGADSSSIGDCRFSGAGKTGEKRRTKIDKTISLQVLRQYFAGSLKDAAKCIGVCPTTLKRICRQHGITRWPSRKIKKVGHSLRKLQVVMDSVQGAEGAFQIESLYANIPGLISPNLSGTNPYSKLKSTDHLKLLNIQTEGIISPLAMPSKSPSSSQGHSSSSSISCSSGTQNQAHTAHLIGIENASMAENSAGILLKRAHSDVDLHPSSLEEPRLQARSQSHKSLSEHPGFENLPSLPKRISRLSQNKGALKVKVTFGEEKAQFSMQSNWNFKDLQQEIVRRFNIDNMDTIHLKYLDDESEWVLLTCDADLEECTDICKVSQSRTIKLSVHEVSHPKLGSSLKGGDPF